MRQIARSVTMEGYGPLCDPLSQLTRPLSLPTRYDLQFRSNF
jgi:hypothetical protein